MVSGGPMPCRIVAALETNHGGDPDVARRLLEAARDVGADGIKFQKRTVAVAGVRQVLDRRLTDHTAHVYPTKLNEYLAMGIPVVSTDLPEIRRFNVEHQDVVAVARTADEFTVAIREAVKPAPPDEIERRIAVARQNGWSVRVANMSSAIAEALAARRRGDTGWEESLGRVYRAARLRMTRSVAVLVATYVLLFYTPIAWLVAEPLRVTEAPRRADMIVVFAGGVGESGRAGGGYQERLKRAVELYHQDYAPRMIFSSGFSFAFREAEVMKILATSLGVPSNVILLEDKAASTYENVVFVGRILELHGWRRILLVSSPYHMRRAVWTFRRVAPQVEVIASPVPASQFYAHGVGASLEQLLGIAHEYAAIGYYAWNGWL